MSVIETDIVADEAPQAVPPPRHEPDGARELIESIVVAFVLAFMFRTFVAEAFVIPTGSMAPTLMGRHKDVACPECGWQYQVGAGDEADARTGRMNPLKMQVVSGVCPMCRFQAPFADVEEAASGEDELVVHDLSFKGDRILVDKGAYDFREPRRWDVVVFKYPGEAETNFIKRLVGLPNETVRIRRGDLLIRKAGSVDFTLARKPPEKVKALLQPVYDCDFVNEWMSDRGWPERWQGADLELSSAWKSIGRGRGYEARAGTEEVWLEYEHLVPSQRDWDFMRKAPLPADYEIRPQLVSDSSAYNSDAKAGSLHEFPLKSVGFHWVGDLAIDCDLKLGPAGTGDSRVDLCLVRGGRKFWCHLDPNSGQAQLEIEGLSDFHPQAATEVKLGSTHRACFANVDRQLLLWIDDHLVEFDRPTSYDDLGDKRPTAEDLRPARIGARSVEIQLTHLKLLRDNYYLAIDRSSGDTDFSPGYRFENETELAEFLSDESRWDVFDSGMRTVDFTLDNDQFFMLGDNSASSSDGRLWYGEQFVRRELLVGKALLVYWPHGWPTSRSVVVPGTELSVPFIPQFGRMGWIH